MRHIFTICVICCVLAPYAIDAQETRVSVSGNRALTDGNEAPAPRMLGPVKHKKRVYVDEQKRLYVALSAPLYLRLSLSPVDHDPSFLLHDPKDTEAAVPFYLDGPGRHSITHPAGYGKPGITMHLYADGEAPKTVARFTGTTMHRDKDSVFYGAGLQVAIESTDDMTGVQQTYVALNDTIYTLYAEQMTLSDEISYRLRYYSVDNVGNSESVSELTFTVDCTPPVINVRYSNAGSGSSERPVYPLQTTIEMEAVDVLSGLERLVYAVNNEPEQPFMQPVRFERPGDYTIVIRASDHVGNSENQVLRFSIQQD